MTSVEQFNGVSLHIRQDQFHLLMSRTTPVDRIVAQEVVTRDCYRLRHLFNAGFVPETVVDLGANIGAFGAFCRVMWPSCGITQVEAMGDFCRQAEINVLGSVVHNRIIGGIPPFHDYKAVPWLRVAYEQATPIEIEDVLPASLLKIDIEGSERVVFDQIRTKHLMPRIGVIVGEWHGKDARLSIVNACHGTHYLLLDWTEDHNTFTAIPMTHHL